VNIDWSPPWLATYRELGEPLARRIRTGASVAEALNCSTGSPVRFVPADALPEGEAYEAFVARTASVPTRDNLHDFFNGLVWLHWPALKLRLNALHVQAMAQAGGSMAPRGPVRDAATLFDENGAWLEAPPALLAALRQRDWPRLFIALRPLWREARLQLFGHALLEKLQQPRKPICAHVLLAGDVQAALVPGFMRHKPFAPLPVLGAPGWWPANEVPDFYADPGVFRQTG